MNSSILKRLTLFVETLYNLVSRDNDRLTISALGTSQYINYLIEKGEIFSSEKEEYSKFAVNILEKKFDSEPFAFIKLGLVEMMQEITTYEYEAIGRIIKKVNESL